MPNGRKSWPAPPPESPCWQVLVQVSNVVTPPGATFQPNARGNDGPAVLKTLIRLLPASATYRLPEPSRARPPGPASSPAPPFELPSLQVVAVVQVSNPVAPPGMTSHPNARMKVPLAANSLIRL